jgi:hypothetical protein
MRRIHMFRTRRLTYANVMATVALIISLAGGAYVAHALQANSVKSFHIKDHEVATRDLARGAAIDKARSVDGSSIEQVSWVAPTGTPYVGNRLFRANGLTVHAECAENDGAVFLRAQTDTNGSIFGFGPVNDDAYGGTAGDAAFKPIDSDFNTVEFAYIELDDTVTTISYGRGGDFKPPVTAILLGNKEGGAGACQVVGTVVSG